MSLAVADLPRLMTVEEFLALPDDGIERHLIDGEIWPREPRTTVRNRRHSLLEARIAKYLGIWLDLQPRPRGEIHSGEAGFRLAGETDTLVGIDVAYVSAELLSRTSANASYFPGPPVLAVEIHSPSDTFEEITRKIKRYLKAGVVVLCVDPEFHTVSAHRPGGRGPTVFGIDDDLTVEPELSGFRVPLARIFED